MTGVTEPSIAPFFVPFPGRKSETVPSSEDPEVILVIPARWESSRFPGKPLAPIHGRPLIEWVAERARGASLVDRVIITSDDDRILFHMSERGHEVLKTSSGARTGSDRVAEVAQQISGEIFVNLQADEILGDVRIIDQAIAPLLKDPGVPISTVKRRITDLSDCANSNVVKVVCNQHHFALYFSRSTIPADRDMISPSRPDLFWDQHLGIYAFRRDALLEFARLPSSLLEDLEKLEQLRALDFGLSIFVARTEFPSYRIDTPSDLEQLAEIESLWNS
ncbi:MAG: 3-deoxy-manno-octulosonate cytidylyltransferase [Leptospirales bacterium]